MTKPKKKYDVLIIGCGMLGNTAALLLAHYGLKVVVIEKKALANTIFAKSARLDEEVMQLLDEIGLGDAIRPHVYPLDGMQVIDKKGRMLLEFNPKQNSPFASLYGFYQPDVQVILQRKLRAHPSIDVLDNCELENIEQQKELVSCYVKAKKRSIQTISVPFVLACNGQNSQLADLLEIDVLSYEYKSAILCVDTKSKAPISESAYAQTIYDAEFPVTRITNDAYHQRWEFQIEEGMVNEAATHEKVRQLLSELCTVDFEVVSAYVYVFDSKQLTAWRKKRFLLAGDAAHVMPPYLGMGLAAGIKDVYNLAWKLQMILKDNFSLSLLENYQAERLPNVQYLIQLNFWIKRLFKSSRLRWIKNLVPILPKWFLKKNLVLSNKIKRGIIGSTSRGGGQPFIFPIVMNPQAKEMGLHRILKNKFAIIGMNKNPVDVLLPRQLEYLAPLHAQFIHIIPKRKRFKSDGRLAKNIYDKHQKLEKWMQEKRAQFVILRPDNIIFEYCQKPSQLNAAVRKLKKLLPLPQAHNETI